MTGSSPIAAKVGFRYDEEKHKFVYEFDTKNFAPNTNKIEIVGRLRQRKFLLECNGKGGFNSKEIRSVEDRLKILLELKDKSLITEEDYQMKKKEILESL